MKNKILTSVMITVILAILIVSSTFMLLINLEQVRSTEEELRNVNSLICENNDMDKEKLAKLKDIKINEFTVRFTLIDTKGNVIYDSEEGNISENHLSRPEIQEALKSGEGHATRYSTTLKSNQMYYATKFDDNLLIRTCVPLNTIKILQKEFLKYYIIIIVFVIIFSILLSLRLVRVIIDPVKDLEKVTLKMASGDYEIRANIKTNDELGTLGNSFNNMADQLQSKIHEVVEKQIKLESILKSMDSGVVAVDNFNNVISINPYAELLLGIRKNIIGECLFDYVTDYYINTFLKQEDESDKEIKLLHPIERDIKIKKSYIMDGSMQIGKVITFQDITEMKRVELIRTQFVANVSHELKTPLTSIKGFAETLRIVEDDKTREKFLDIINKEAERLTRLINDILVLSNIESNSIADIEEFLPLAVLEDVINLMKEEASNKNITVEFKDNNNEVIYVNKDKFYQLSLNLIENAIKYTNNLGKVNVYSYSKDGYYYLKVKDSGIGIPKEDMPRIFERFYRVDKSRKKGGTGLGLAIVKHIVKTFNGTITVESELGIGTVFQVKIPIR